MQRSRRDKASKRFPVPPSGNAGRGNLNYATAMASTPSIADFLVQCNEEDSDVLRRKLFNVNMRLFKSNVHYKAIVLAAVDYMSYVMDQQFSDYPELEGISGASVGIPFNIIGYRLHGRKHFIINPKITSCSKERQVVKSNCGSLRLVDRIEVTRPAWVEVEGFAPNGFYGAVRGSDLGAILEQEVEHNLGILIIDKQTQKTTKQRLKTKTVCVKCQREAIMFIAEKPLCDEHLKDEPRCSECDQAAEYDSPAQLCGEHWAKWWADDIPGEVPRTKRERKADYKEAMKVVEATRRGETYEECETETALEYRERTDRREQEPNHV